MQMNITAEWLIAKEALEAGREIGAGTHQCFCTGPRNGQPLCPCMMRDVTIENGRYVERRDLGPVSSPQGNKDTRRAAIKAAAKSLEPKL